ncbi:mediator of RNA polymerase II transcription subunit 15 isoform X2 [Marmota monax]|uniref:mediator of RNA polymerase II transcription subunit 15 isoform X2 n=1 Tax=Marmota monax TaxID=9995 RepID=UPI001EB0626E|nr:mediator of RNA polymerase II transcription subunit 15 isoform X2 [Marmota monax]
MDVWGQETDWRSAAFRQKLVSQIEDAMRTAGVGHSISSKDMENHVFLKAKTRNEHQPPEAANRSTRCRLPGLRSPSRTVPVFVGQDKDEYLSLVARLIIHFRDIWLSRGAPASWNP